MARRVFFHIGAPKTGTTFLQTVMWNHRNTLETQGVLYPGRRIRDHLYASQVVGEALRPKRRARHSDSWDRVVSELAAWPGTGLISHEFFGMASADQARAAIDRLAPAEVHVVMTARDYGRQFTADWQESLKMNSDLSLDEFMDHAMRQELRRPWGWNSHDVVAILDRWGESIPNERVHLITVPKPGAQRDLLFRRWCKVLELDPDDFDLDIGFANQSLGAAQAALLHLVKPHLSGPLRRGPEKHRWLRGYFAHEVLLAQSGERFSLRPRHFEQLREKADEAVTAIQRAGYDVTGDLAELVPEHDATPRTHPDDIADAELLEVATIAIEQMVRDVRRLTLDRDEWRRKAQGDRSRRGHPSTPEGRGVRQARRLARRIRG